MEDKRTWNCVKKPFQAIVTLLTTIVCSVLGSSRRPLTTPSNVVAKKTTHFHPIWSKFNFVWGGRRGVASFSNLTEKVPTVFDLHCSYKCKIVSSSSKKGSECVPVHSRLVGSVQLAPAHSV